MSRPVRAYREEESAPPGALGWMKNAREGCGGRARRSGEYVLQNLQRRGPPHEPLNRTHNRLARTPGMPAS